MCAAQHCSPCTIAGWLTWSVALRRRMSERDSDGISTFIRRMLPHGSVRTARGQAVASHRREARAPPCCMCRQPGEDRRRTRGMSPPPRGLQGFMPRGWPACTPEEMTWMAFRKSSKLYLGCSPVSTSRRRWPCCCSAATSSRSWASERAERCGAVGGCLAGRGNTL